MSFALSVFDVFAYGIPGSLYLGVILYGLWRAGLGDVLASVLANEVLAILAVAGASYLLGHATYGIGRWISRRFEVTAGTLARARAMMLDRIPRDRGRSFLERDPSLLLAGLQLKHPDAAAEVSRLRASGVMLRNCAPAFLLIVVAAMEETILGSYRWQAAAIAGIAIGLAVSCALRGAELSTWAFMKTFELAYWGVPVRKREAAE